MGNAKSKVGPGEPNPQQDSIEADEAVFIQKKRRKNIGEWNLLLKQYHLLSKKSL